MTLTNIVMINAVCYENFKGEKYLAYLGYEDKAKLEEKLKKLIETKLINYQQVRLLIGIK